MSVHYPDPEVFNSRVFDRLIQSIRRHTQQTTDQGKKLSISIGIWHGHEFSPAPTVSEVIGYAQQASAPIH